MPKGCLPTPITPTKTSPHPTGRTPIIPWPPPPILESGLESPWSNPFPRPSRLCRLVSNPFYHSPCLPRREPWWPQRVVLISLPPLLMKSLRDVAREWSRCPTMVPCTALGQSPTGRDWNLKWASSPRWTLPEPMTSPRDCSLPNPLGIWFPFPHRCERSSCGGAGVAGAKFGLVWFLKHGKSG